MQYIRNTFDAAKDSMSINGMDSGEMETELAKAQAGEGMFKAESAQSNRTEEYAQRSSPSTPNWRRGSSLCRPRSRTTHCNLRICAGQLPRRLPSALPILSPSRQKRTMRGCRRMKRRSWRRLAAPRWTLARSDVWTRSRARGRMAPRTLSH